LKAYALCKLGGIVKMGFSLVAAFAVIGISILIAIEIFTGSLLPAITDVDESYDDLLDRTVKMAQTNINISSVFISTYGLNYNHSITLKNTGSITLNTSDFTILINGVTQQFSCPDSYLYPEKETYLNVPNLPGDGNKRLKVISENGISDYYEYII
jgi:archaellum component FlaF (FlaF/FlaG flagellin family)